MMSSDDMPETEDKICVFYDGACPSCVKDRANYERLAGEGGQQVDWVDITNKDQQLKEMGIDPKQAMLELHVRDQNGTIHSEIDAYVLLMSRVRLLRPVAWFINLEPVRKVFSKIYRRWVRQRLEKDGRL